ncbi:hypothetical protein VARV_SAF65_103_176 [Variola virus]|uniref:Uncharacterized protein n=1 Tax=Variola virus TaxID=10255 RepID=Q0NBV0_VARV|nr:hypothetical protein VARV_BOT72_143_176 [Variola virus]ABF23339.1 hypothetical protein VARV_BOT73_225_176 [Variola virus]ABF26956.1 hypothetical protein VARV_SAF65_103_176 [Variola virus]
MYVYSSNFNNTISYPDVVINYRSWTKCTHFFGLLFDSRIIMLNFSIYSVSCFKYVMMNPYSFQTQV